MLARSVPVSTGTTASPVAKLAGDQLVDKLAS
jgi:hypothetical protein